MPMPHGKSFVQVVVGTHHACARADDGHVECFGCGSGMYTNQALWTMARENADVTVVIMNNRSYAILNIELARVGAGRPTPETLSMLDLSNPNLDFVSLAEGMGVTATRARSAEEFDAQLAEAMGRPGPRLIEAMVVQQMP